MNFHSLQFGIFLIVVTLGFWALARRRNSRTVLLLAASLLFYGLYNWWYLGLIVFSTLLDFHLGNVIATSESPRRRKWALIGSLAGNLGVLGFFKYWDWGVESLALAFGALGLDLPVSQLGIVVPVGISFYTFQTLSYTIDLYRGAIRPARNLLDFALFVSFFPQLVAGPIVRAKHFLPQLELPPRFSRERLHDGLYRLGLGLGKKVLVADILGTYLVDPVFGSPELWTPWVHLLAIYGFMFQIYFDFSGYSDIAIGTARLVGFDLPENFIKPLQAIGIRDFWRRWHISLSSWVRDYLYIPLGGSRGSELKVARNLIITMLVMGLWHGSSMLWLTWGLFNGIAMTLERWMQGKRGGGPYITNRWRFAISWTATFHLLVFSFILIRAESFAMVGGLFTRFGDSTEISHLAWWALAFAALTHFQPDRRMRALQARVSAMPTWALGAGLGVLCATLMLVMTGETPFIYFQF